jgi:hypothetical protein
MVIVCCQYIYNIKFNLPFIILQDDWISALKEPLLPEETTIYHLVCSSPSTVKPQDDCDDSNVHDYVTNTGQTTMCASISQSTSNDEHLTSGELEITVVSDDIDLYTVSVQSEEDVKIKKTPVHDLNKLISSSLTDVRNIMKSYKLRSDSEDYSKCHSLLSLLTFYRTDFLSSNRTQSIFPTEVLCKYNLMGPDPHLDDLFDNDFNIECRRNAVLCMLSEWLGNQFRTLSPMVEEKVLTFKKEHIGCIDNLPPATEIIDSIFPRCMSLFVYHWLTKGENVPQFTQTTKSTIQTHGKKSKIDYHSDSVSKIAPLAQIILEFANNTLISGVAHVVYAQVMQHI